MSGRTDEVLGRLEGRGQAGVPGKGLRARWRATIQVEVLKTSALCKDAMKEIFPHP